MIRTRPGLARDLERLTEIFNHYVIFTNVTFDEVPSTLEQRKLWFRNFNSNGKYRVFVAEESGIVLGCAYTTRFRDHPAFARTVETSIYLDPDVTRRGVGTQLYTHLFEELAKQDVHRAVAGIALPNPASVALHKKFGFAEVGIFNEYAFKRGKPLSAIWLEKKL